MRLLAFAILVACVQSVCAQSILKDPKELSVLLNEVVVTGTGTEHYLKDAPVQTEVITGKALDSYQGRSMQDILEGLNASITRQYRTYRNRKRCRLFPVWLGRYRRCHQYYHEKEPG